MAPDEQGGKTAVEAWMQSRVADSFYCPKFKITLTRRACAERHVKYAETRWFGQMIEAPCEPGEKFCRGCPLGKLHAERLGLQSQRPKK